MSEKIRTRIFPVIHFSPNPELNLEQILTAYDGGADGVFVIHHKLLADKFSSDLDSLDSMARLKYENDLAKWPPDFDIGVNYLGANSTQAGELFKPYMSMLWSDDSFIDLNNDGFKQGSMALKVIKKIRGEGNTKSEFFGGIAFKYRAQPDYEELHRLLSLACSIDGYVVTTSGEATGSAPTVEKIKMFREIMPAYKRLAVASGASVVNVGSLIEAGVTDFLVASSICTGDVLDCKKLKDFIDEARKN